MNTKPRNNDHAFTLRLPTDLYDELKARAEADDRTWHGCCVDWRMTT